ncbi:MAG: hypothetical protein ABI616_02565 [Pseudomonadota bacterium]
MANTRYFMVRIRQLAQIGGIACLTLLSGCAWFGSKNCQKPQVYEEAKSVPPLRIPQGLDGIDTRGALKIPELTGPEPPRPAADAPCLDEPPQLVTPASPAPAAARPPPK